LQDSALQGDRRAPPTVATGDESPMNCRECRVQRAFSSGLLALLCSAHRYPMNGAPNSMGEPAREGPNDRKKGEHFFANRPPTSSDAWVAWERCSGSARVVVYLYPKPKPRPR
jgi:hypothetical protein